MSRGKLLVITTNMDRESCPLFTGYSGRKSADPAILLPCGVSNLRRMTWRRHSKYLPRYALVHEESGFEFLIDTHRLHSISHVIVRRGRKTCEVNLYGDETSAEVHFSDFHRRDDDRILALVLLRFEELITWWYEIRNDWKRDRLERNVLVD